MKTKEKNVKKSIIYWILHIGFFVIIELIFIKYLFDEDTISMTFFSFTGIGHTLYTLSLIPIGYIRERVGNWWQKAIVSFLPIVLHVTLHVGLLGLALHEHNHKIHHHEHLHLFDEKVIWGVIGISIIILVGEFTLHKLEKT